LAKEPKKTSFQVTRMGAVGWSVVVFCAMGWMFVLGVLVGRGSVPLPFQSASLEDELSALKTAELQNDMALVDGPDQPVQTTELGFYEALKKPPPKETRRVSALPAVAKKPAAVVAARPAAKAPITAAPAQKVEPKPKPTAPPPNPSEPLPKPAPPPKAAAEPKNDKPAATPAPSAPVPLPAAQAAVSTSQGGRFTVQVAAFKDSSSADQLVGRLRAKGYPVYALRSDTPDGPALYRVRVGAFANRAAAEKVLKKLGSDQIKGMVVATP